MTREEWRKQKRLRHQKLGISEEWFTRNILVPVMMIISIYCVSMFINTKYQSYAQNKLIQEEIKKEIQESISVEESIKAESKRAKEELRLKEEKRERELLQAELEKQKSNTLWEDRITKKVVCGKKYWRNNKTMRVGKVESIYGLQVVLNNDWSFELDGNGNIPEHITNIGYREYIQKLTKQKEQEEKKHENENARRLQQILDKELAELTEEIKSKLDTNYIQLGSEKYRVWDIRGDQLICTKFGDRKKKNNYIKITYSDMVKCIGYREYERVE